MATDDFETTVEELYGGPPDQFIATRDAAVKRARAAGDRELAERIRQLRRPTAAAALLNRHRRAGESDDLDALVELGEQLRAAQQKLDAPALRALSAERTPRINAVIDAIAAEESGDELTATVREQLSQTLTAAVADADAARAVLSGHLVAALSYSGFGEVDLSEAVAVPLDGKEPAQSGTGTRRAGKSEQDAEKSEKTAKGKKRGRTGTRDSAKTQAEEARAAAERRLEEALAILTKAQRDEESAQEAAELADRALAAAERTAKNARERVDRAGAARAAAEEAVTAARSEVSPS